MFEGAVSVVSPGSYAVSDGVGDIDGSVGEGLFYRDVRHLSEFRLGIGGEAPIPLASRVRGSEAVFASSACGGGVGVVRRRRLGDGMEEEILLRNEAPGAVEVRVELWCAADFRDVFEVRGYRAAAGRGVLSERADEGYLRFGYRRGEFGRGTVVRVSGVETVVEPGRIVFELRLEAGEERVVRVSVALEEGGEEVSWPRLAPLYGEVPALETG